MLNLIVDKIYKKIQEFTYLDLYVYSYSNNTLVIAGSTDLYYFHNFEIRFKHVFAINCNFSLSINTSDESIKVLEKNELADSINLKHMVDIGNSIFQIITDEEDSFYIIAEEIELVDEVVRYY
jgi:hypothetical protein